MIAVHLQRQRLTESDYVYTTLVVNDELQGDKLSYSKRQQSDSDAPFILTKFGPSPEFVSQ